MLLLRQYLYFRTSKASKARLIRSALHFSVASERVFCVSICTFVLVKQVKYVPKYMQCPPLLCRE
jgi:hypothetical protein